MLHGYFKMTPINLNYSLKLLELCYADSHEHPCEELWADKKESDEDSPLWFIAMRAYLTYFKRRLVPTLAHREHLLNKVVLKPSKVIKWRSLLGQLKAEMSKTKLFLFSEQKSFKRLGLSFLKSSLEWLSRGSRYRRWSKDRSYDHGFLVLGLQRFGENMSGGQCSMLVYRNLVKVATEPWVVDMASFHARLVQIFNLSRIKNPKPVNSPRHQWYGGAKAVVSSIYARDPFILTLWIQKRLKRMRLFAHRKFIRLLGTLLKYFVELKPEESKILGFVFLTTGKISVTGNAMSRNMLVRYGKSGINNLSYRASKSFTLIKTKTGCLGLNMSFYF